jgi:hypothetical protein
MVFYGFGSNEENHVYLKVYLIMTKNVTYLLFDSKYQSQSLLLKLNYEKISYLGF